MSFTLIPHVQGKAVSRESFIDLWDIERIIIEKRRLSKWPRVGIIAQNTSVWLSTVCCSPKIGPVVKLATMVAPDHTDNREHGRSM
jgi:hypothetical protein